MPSSPECELIGGPVSHHLQKARLFLEAVDGRMYDPLWLGIWTPKNQHCAVDLSVSGPTCSFKRPKTQRKQEHLTRVAPMSIAARLVNNFQKPFKWNQMTYSIHPQKQNCLPPKKR